MIGVSDICREVQTAGYCIVPALYSPDELLYALDSVRKGYAQVHGLSAGETPYLNQNQTMLHNVQNKDFEFLKLMLRDPLILEVLKNFLNDRWYRVLPDEEPNFQLRSYLARSSEGELPLHIDSFIPYMGEHVISMQVAIVLEEMTEKNGCTVVVPGSHQSGRYVEQSALDDAVPIEASIGDAVIWDSRLWHGTTANMSGNTRWNLVATFARWWMKQSFQIPLALPKYIYEQLTDSEKTIMGYSSIPYLDEYAGTNMKQDHSNFPDAPRDLLDALVEPGKA